MRNVTTAGDRQEMIYVACKPVVKNSHGNLLYQQQLQQDFMKIKILIAVPVMYVNYLMKLYW